MKGVSGDRGYSTGENSWRLKIIKHR